MSASTKEQATLEGRLLVVDDAKDLCRLVSQCFKSKFHTDTANDPEVALEMFEKDPYDIVILDLVMPKMDGIEVLEKIREITKDTEIIILTGHASLETAVKAITLGTYAYMRKPVQLDQLMVMVRRAYESVCLKRANDRLNRDLKEANRQLTEEVGNLAASLAEKSKLATLGEGLAGLAMRIEDPIDRISGIAGLHQAIVQRLLGVAHQRARQ